MEGGSAGCLSRPLNRARIDLSLLQRQSTSQEKHGRLRKPPDIFQHQSTGYLRTRRQETLYETCACVIHTTVACAL